jgi:hypothetical protein
MKRIYSLLFLLLSAASFAQNAPIKITCDESQTQCKNADGSLSAICCPSTSTCSLDPTGRFAAGCVVGGIGDCGVAGAAQCGGNAYKIPVCCSAPSVCGYTVVNGVKYASGCVLPNVKCPTASQECRNGNNVECCNSTESCVNGACKPTVCPAGQFYCGNPPGGSCCDTKTQTCAASLVGGVLTGTCQAKPPTPGRCNPPQYPCSSTGNLSAPPPSTLCCNPGTTCFPNAPAVGQSTCCPTGYLLAPNAQGKWGCVAPDRCGNLACNTGTYCCDANHSPSATGGFCCPYKKADVIATDPQATQ